MKFKQNPAQKTMTAFAVAAASMLALTACGTAAPAAPASPTAAATTTVAMPNTKAMTDTAMADSHAMTDTMAMTDTAMADSHAMTDTMAMTDTKAMTDTAMADSHAMTDTMAMTDTKAMSDTAMADAHPMTDTMAMTDTKAMTDTAMADPHAMTDTMAMTDTKAMSGTVMDGMMMLSGGKFYKVQSLVAGSVELIKSAKGDLELQFKGFSVAQTPDLRVVLTSLDPVPLKAGMDLPDAIDLGGLKKANGDQTYAIPAGADLTKVKSVVIWSAKSKTAQAAAALAK